MLWRNLRFWGKVSKYILSLVFFLQGYRIWYPPLKFAFLPGIRDVCEGKIVPLDELGNSWYVWVKKLKCRTKMSREAKTWFTIYIYIYIYIYIFHELNIFHREISLFLNIEDLQFTFTFTLLKRKYFTHGYTFTQRIYNLHLNLSYIKLIRYTAGMIL